MDTLFQKDIEVARQRTRAYIVDCSICHRWSSVPTLEIQSICREAGVCPACMRNDFFLLRVRIAAIEMHLESLKKKGQALPEDEREPLREMYSRKARQLADARAKLESLT